MINLKEKKNDLIADLGELDVVSKMQFLLSINNDIKRENSQEIDHI